MDDDEALRLSEERQEVSGREPIPLSTDPAFVSIVERARRRYKDEGGVSSEDVRRIFAEDLGS
jgi:hypothetical protein